MSDDNNNEFITTTDQPATLETPGQLRTKLESAIALLKEKDTEIESLKTAQAETAARLVWDELGVPQPIRDMYRGDTTPDGIRSWWEQSKSLFNVPAAESASTETPEQRAQHEQLAAVQNAAGLGSDVNAGTGFDVFKTRASELERKSGRVSQAELDDWYRSAGIPQGFERVVRT